MIRTDALTKRFGGVAAVDGLTMAVPPGSVVGLLGPNGAGKTTLLKLLIGLVRPTAGTGRVLGRDVVSDSVAIRRAVAFVPESKAVYRSITAGAYLRFYGGFFPDTDPAGARKLLGRWGVDPGARVENMSRGARSKLVVAAALARGSRLLLLDEPSDGLDPGAIEDLWTALMRRVGAPEGAGVVVSTHRLDEVERVCDRVLVLDRGRLVLEGEIDELRTRWRRLRLRVADGPDAGDTIAGTIPGLISVRDRAGVQEATTSAWDASLPERVVAVGAELLDVREMGLREIYLAAVSHER